MAKKEPPPPKGCPAWQGTFGDLMNLLLCFFVLLYAMSSVDAAKFDEIAASFSTAFGIFKGGDTSFGDGALVGDGVSQLTELSNYVTSMGVSQSGSTTTESSQNTGTQASDNSGGESDQTEAIDEEGTASAISDATTAEALENASTEELTEALEEAQMEASAELAEEIQEAMVEEQIDEVMELNYTGQYVQLTVQGAILFESGKADLKEDVLPILDKASSILERYAGGTVEIEGHTDNVPVSAGGRYANNDELSDARALSVFYYICDNSALDPANIKHSGRGEYDPIADNTTPEGRAKNRRVEIRIYNPLSPMY
ncbi:MAG: flagellar motor protein MotB [Butyrivibrio sp.]|nr:flagellar motor protein MotB [Butyrivibrio sp.]